MSRPSKPSAGGGSRFVLRVAGALALGATSVRPASAQVEPPPAAAPSAEEPPRPTADLVYDAGGDRSCPDAASFTNLVAARLGYDPFVTGSERLLSVKIVAQGERLVATVWLEDARGEPRRRTLEAGLAECASLAEALATAVGIALDPLYQMPPPVPVDPPPPAPVPLPPPLEPDRPPVPPPTVGEGTPIRFRAVVGPTAAFGLAPGPTLGAAIGLGAKWPSWSAVIEGRFDTLTDSATLDSGDEVSASSLTAGPTACFHVAWWTACATAQLGAFQGEAENLLSPEPSPTFSAKVGIATGAELALTRHFGVRLLGELGVPLVRTSLQIDDEPVWTAPVVHGGLGLGAVLALP